MSSKISETNQQQLDNNEADPTNFKKSNARGRNAKKQSMNSTFVGSEGVSKTNSLENSGASKIAKKRKIDEMTGYEEDKSTEEDEKGTKKMRLNDGQTILKGSNYQSPSASKKQ